MKHPKLRKELFLAITFSTIYLLLNIFQYHLENILQGLPVNIIIIAILILLVILLGIQIFKIFRRRKKSKGRIKLKFIFYIPAIILLFAILYTFSPFKLDSEKLESKIILRGCYEGGNSNATIAFRADKSFEIKWKGETGYLDRYHGIYRTAKDTFYLTYFDNSPEKFGSVVINSGQSLICLDKSIQLENYFIIFYIGPCKGTRQE